MNIYSNKSLGGLLTIVEDLIQTVSFKVNNNYVKTAILNVDELNKNKEYIDLQNLSEILQHVAGGHDGTKYYQIENEGCLNILQKLNSLEIFEEEDLFIYIHPSYSGITVEVFCFIENDVAPLRNLNLKATQYNYNYFVNADVENKKYYNTKTLTAQNNLVVSVKHNKANTYYLSLGTAK